MCTIILTCIHVHDLLSVTSILTSYMVNGVIFLMSMKSKLVLDIYLQIYTICEIFLILARDSITTGKIAKTEVFYRCGSCRAGKNNNVIACYRESMDCDL